MQAAHDSGIVHRDLKPDNLFIITRENKPFVKLLDFGVSKFDAELTGGMGMTKEGATLGTPFYMPPEQVRGEKDIDARADVYALGVILYECASGKRPFEADTLPHLALLIHEGKPQPLEELRPDLPPSFGELVRRAMASDRKQRFATARDLAEALAQFGGVSLDATMEGPAPVMVRTGSASAHSADLGPTMPGGQAISVAQDAKPRRAPRPASSSPRRRSWRSAAGSQRAASCIRPRRKHRAQWPQPPPRLRHPVPTPVPTPAAPEVTAAPVASASAAPIAVPAAPLAKNHAPGAPPAAHTPPPPAATPPPAAPATKTSTRVDQKGLANDNPFK